MIGSLRWIAPLSMPLWTPRPVFLFSLELSWTFKSRPSPSSHTTKKPNKNTALPLFSVELFSFVFRFRRIQKKRLCPLSAPLSKCRQSPSIEWGDCPVTEFRHLLKEYPDSPVLIHRKLKERTVPSALAKTAGLWYNETVKKRWRFKWRKAR